MLARVRVRDIGARTAVDACRYFAGLIVGAVRGRIKSELLSSRFFPGDKPDYWQKNPLDPKIAAIAAGSFKTKDPPEIKGSGYVVESLEAALWAFDRSRSFREGALLAVNLVTMRIRPVRFTVSWPAHSMVQNKFRRNGEQDWSCTISSLKRQISSYKGIRWHDRNLTELKTVSRTVGD
jgi:hypothetical protein